MASELAMTVTFNFVDIIFDRFFSLDRAFLDRAPRETNIAL